MCGLPFSATMSQVYPGATNRRDMLRLLMASAAAEALGFERLLWVPKWIIAVPTYKVDWMDDVNRVSVRFRGGDPRELVSVNDVSLLSPADREMAIKFAKDIY